MNARQAEEPTRKTTARDQRSLRFWQQLQQATRARARMMRLLARSLASAWMPNGHGASATGFAFAQPVVRSSSAPQAVEGELQRSDARPLHHRVELRQALLRMSAGASFRKVARMILLIFGHSTRTCWKAAGLCSLRALGRSNRRDHSSNLWMSSQRSSRAPYLSEETVEARLVKSAS